MCFSAEFMNSNQMEHINLKLRKFAFTKWVNYILRDQQEIEEIEHGISDGFFLIKIIQKLRNQTLNKDPKLISNEHAKISNMRKAFEIMKNDGLKFSHIAPQDICSCPENLEAIMEVVWALIVRYHILHREEGFVPLPSDSHIKKIMLTWVNSLLPDSKITNFAGDWSDGTALQALLEFCQNRTNANWVTLKNNKKPGVDLLLHSLSKAQERHGIPDLLGGCISRDSNGLMDEYAVMTYLAFYTAFPQPDRNAKIPKDLLRGPVPIRVLDWVNSKLEPTLTIRNFRSDWVDGKALHMLLDSFSNQYIAQGPGEENAGENVFKENLTLSILEESINKAKEFGVQPLISARELRSGKLNTFYMLAYLSQFLRLDTNVDKKKILHDELTQKFRVIKRELKHIPPLTCRLNGMADSSPSGSALKHVPSIPPNLASEIKEVYLKRLNSNSTAQAKITKNGDKIDACSDARNGEWTDFASVKRNFDDKKHFNMAPKTGPSPVARKIKLATAAKEVAIVKADPSLVVGFNDGASKEIREVFMIDTVPGILPLGQKMAYTIAIPKSRTNPFKNDSLLLWIHPPGNSKMSKYPGTIEIRDAPIDSKALKNSSLPGLTNKDDLLDREKFEIYTISFTVKDIGEHRLQFLMNGKEIFPFKDVKETGKEAISFKVYDINKVTYQPIPYCVRDILTTIYINAKDSGPGKLEVLINNGVTKSTIRSLGTKKFAVDFIPELVPSIKSVEFQTIEMRFNGHHIPKSPFVCPLFDIDKICFSGKGLGPAIKLNTSMEFTLETCQNAIRLEHIKACIVPISSHGHLSLNKPTQDSTPINVKVVGSNIAQASRDQNLTFKFCYSLPKVGFYSLSLAVMDPCYVENFDCSKGEINPTTAFLTLPFPNLQQKLTSPVADNKTLNKIILKAFDPSAIKLADPSILTQQNEVSQPGDAFEFNIEIGATAGEGHLELAVDGGTIPNSIQLLPPTVSPHSNPGPGAAKICRVNFIPSARCHAVEVKFNGHPVPQSPFSLQFRNVKNSNGKPQLKIEQEKPKATLKLRLGDEEYTASSVTQLARSELMVGQLYNARIFTNELNECALNASLVACDMPSVSPSNQISIKFDLIDSRDRDRLEYASEINIPQSGNYELSIRLTPSDLGLRLILKASTVINFPKVEDLILQRFGFVDELYHVQVKSMLPLQNIEWFLVCHSNPIILIPGTVKCCESAEKYSINFHPTNFGVHQLRLITNQRINDYPIDVYIFPSPKSNPPLTNMGTCYYDNNTLDPGFFFEQSQFLKHLCGGSKGDTNAIILEIGKNYEFTSNILPYLAYLPTIKAILILTGGTEATDQNVETLIYHDVLKISVSPKTTGQWVLNLTIGERILTSIFVVVIDPPSITFLKDEWSNRTFSVGLYYQLQMDLSKCGSVGPFNLELSPLKSEKTRTIHCVDKESFQKIRENELSDNNCQPDATYYNYEIIPCSRDILIINLGLIGPKGSDNTEPTAYSVCLKGWPLADDQTHLWFKIYDVKLLCDAQKLLNNTDSIIEKFQWKIKNNVMELIPAVGSLYPCPMCPDSGISPAIATRAFRPTYFLLRICADSVPTDPASLVDCQILEVTETNCAGANKIDKVKRCEISFKVTQRSQQGMVDQVLAVEFVPCRVGRYRALLKSRLLEDLTPLTFEFGIYDAKKVVTSFYDSSLDETGPRVSQVPPLALNRPLGIEVDCAKSGGVGNLEVKIVNSSDPDMEPLPIDIETVEKETKYNITFVPTIWAPSYEIYINFNNDPVPGSPFIATFSSMSNADSKDSLSRIENSDILPMKYIDSVTNSYSDHNSAGPKGTLFGTTESSPSPVYQEVDASMEKIISSPAQIPKLLSTEIYNGKDVDCEPVETESQQPLHAILGQTLTFSVTLPESWLMRGEDTMGNMVSNVALNLDREVKGKVEISQGAKKNVVIISCELTQPGPHSFKFQPKTMMPGLAQTSTNLITKSVNVFATKSKSHGKHSSYVVQIPPALDKVKRATPCSFSVFGPAVMSPSDIMVYGKMYPGDSETDKMDFHVTTNPDFGLDIMFVPEYIGELNVHIRVEGNDITGSPVIFRIYDPCKIVVQNLKYGFLRNSKDTWFLIDAHDAGIGDLELTVSVDGVKIPNYVQLFERIFESTTTNHFGHPKEVQQKKTIFKVTFEPNTTQNHTVEIRFNGHSVSGSPFICFILDPQQFRLSGPNLEFAEHGELNRFFIEMPKPYLERLDLAELRAQLSLVGGHKMVALGSNLYKDNDRMVVEFKPTVVGPYEILILVQGVAVLERKGRECCNIFNPALVHVSKLKERIKINKEYKISVDTFKAGAGHLKIQMHTQTQPFGGIGAISVPVILCSLFSSERNKDTPLPETKYYEACYTTQNPGKHTIEITYNDIPVKGSPFIVEAEKGKAIVWGPGLCSFPLEYIPAYFHIDLKQAYSDHGIFSSRKKEKKLEVIILDPFGTIIPWQYREEQAAGSEASFNNYVLNPRNSINPFTIEYYPLQAGTHSVSLRYGNNISIGSSPYSVSIYGSEQVMSDVKETVGEGAKELQITNQVSSSPVIQASEIGYVGEVYSIDVQVPANFPSKHPEIRIKPAKEKRFKSPDDILHKFSPQSHHPEMIPSPTSMELSYTLGRTGTKGKYQVSFTPTRPCPYIVSATLDGTSLPGFPTQVTIERPRSRKDSPFSPLSPLSSADSESRLGKHNKALTRKSAPSLLANSNSVELNSHATGPGLYGAKVGGMACFTLHHITGTEEIDVIITGPHNSLIPCKCYHQQNGDYKVEYQPDLIGKYQIDISIGNSQIEGSPFYCNVFDPSKVLVSSLPESPHKLSLGEELTFYAKCSDAGDAEFNVQVYLLESRDVRKNMRDVCHIQRSSKSHVAHDYDILIKATRPGEYHVNPTYGGHDILTGPFVCHVEQSVEPTIRATGDGLRKGIEGELCRFKVFIDHYDPKLHGSAPDISVKIEGPNSLPDVSIHSQDSCGAYSVTYTPPEIGNFNILIQQGSQIIGPYIAHICNPHKLKILTTEAYDGLVLLKDVEKNITLDSCHAGPGSLSVEIQVLTAGDSRLVKIPCKVEHLPANANYFIVFKPTLEGQYYVHLKWDGYSLPCSPLMGKCEIMNSPVVATKDNNGVCGTQSHSPQTLLASIERLLSHTLPDPSNPLCKITGSGLGPRIAPNKPYQLTLDFTLLHKGIGLVIADTSKVSGRFFWQGIGADTMPILGIEVVNRLKIQDSKSAINSMENALNPLVKLVPCKISSSGQQNVRLACSSIMYPFYKYSYEVLASGDYKLIMGIERQRMSRAIFQRSDETDHDYNVIKLPGSPIAITCQDPFSSPELSDYEKQYGIGPTLTNPNKSVNNGNDNYGEVGNESNASKVRVFGPGIKSGVLAHFQSQFSIDTKGACAGQLTVKIRGPKSAFQVNMRRDATRDRVIHCQYDPTEPGDYHVHVKWSGDHVPGSPFTVIIYDTFQELRQASTLSPPKIMSPLPIEELGEGILNHGRTENRTNDGSPTSHNHAKRINGTIPTSNKCLRGFNTLSYEDWKKL